MKKKLIIIFIVLIITLLGFKGYQFIKRFNLYSNITNSNWDIDLPDDYKEIYSTDSGESFLGDGERYHVFQYDDYDNINFRLNWSTEKSPTLELNIGKILKNLNVPEENTPNFQYEYKYYYKTEDNSSKVYIVFIPDLKQAYIIEDIQ